MLGARVARSAQELWLYSSSSSRGERPLEKSPLEVKSREEIEDNRKRTKLQKQSRSVHLPRDGRSDTRRKSKRPRAYYVTGLSTMGFLVGRCAPLLPCSPYSYIGLAPTGQVLEGGAPRRSSIQGPQTCVAALGKLNCFALSIWPAIVFSFFTRPPSLTSPGNLPVGRLVGCRRRAVSFLN